MGLGSGVVTAGLTAIVQVEMHNTAWPQTRDAWSVCTGQQLILDLIWYADSFASQCHKLDPGSVIMRKNQLSAAGLNIQPGFAHTCS